jgi:phosphoribosylglycinamide formyltransferase-1
LSENYPVSDKLKIAVFASGRGSNFRAVLDAIEGGKIQNAGIVLVISNNQDAGALAIAREHGIPAVHISQKQFREEKAYHNAIVQLLHEHGVNFIMLAGYMKMLDPSIIQQYKNRIVNIHPALLPAFGGKGMYGHHVHEAVIASGVKTSGATVHIVDEEYDNGPIVLQKSVDVSGDDTAETLATKVLHIEHEIYPEAIRLFAEGRVKIDGRKVSIISA